MTQQERVWQFVRTLGRFGKWGVMRHFESLHGKDRISQPGTERILRRLATEGKLKHPDFFGQPETGKYEVIAEGDNSGQN